MIVTCESCTARYKLDDSRIAGRGAKITCPKCKHIFVVYKPGDAPAPAPEPPKPAPSPGESWDDEPTRIAIMPPRGTASTKGIQVGVLRRGNEGPDRAQAAVPPTHETELGAAAPSVQRRQKEVAARAASLDFKEVGVNTWKVKVRIGLIYDFSDIKTLRKYIQDGRVTPADVISYDGRNWQPIGEIPDLDAFFVDTWERLQVERSQKESAGATLMPAPSPSPSPALGPEAAPATAAAPAAAAGREPATGSNPFRDPFDELKSKQRERLAKRRKRSPTPDSGGDGRTAGIYALMLLLLVGAGGGAAWYYGQTEVPRVRTNSTTPTAARSSEEDIRARIQQEILEGTTSATPDELIEAPPPAGDGETAYVPPGIPAGATPVLPPEATRNAVRGTGTTPTSAVQSKSATATDHEAMGDASARTQDWAGATKAYANAVALDASNGRLLRKLGEAHYRGGDLDSAIGPLQDASKRGQRDAFRLLGHIFRDQGDISNATYHYDQYLLSNPRDAAEIQRILKEMSGA